MGFYLTPRSRLGRELGELSDDVAEDTTVVFTADHGQVEVSDYIDLYEHGIEQDLEVRNGDVISPYGTKRAVFLHLKDGREEAVRRKLSDLNLRMYTPDEAINAGFFSNGDVSDRLRERIGDFCWFRRAGSGLVRRNARTRCACRSAP